MIFNKTNHLAGLMQRSPAARADIRGDAAHGGIRGTVSFYPAAGGVLAVAEVFGLPSGANRCDGGVFGCHIHEGTSCTGTIAEPFADTKGHYNPTNCSHPQHAGDMPPLFENNGYAWSAFFTKRFKVNDIIGRTVILHASPDDFTTQPSGNSGKKIACGVIERI